MSVRGAPEPHRVPRGRWPRRFPGAQRRLVGRRDAGRPEAGRRAGEQTPGGTGALGLDRRVVGHGSFLMEV